MFEGDYKLIFHLAPPLLARKDPATGEPRKTRFGAVDAAGVPRAGEAEVACAARALDVFGYTDERAPSAR